MAQNPVDEILRACIAAKAFFLVRDANEFPGHKKQIAAMTTFYTGDDKIEQPDSHMPDWMLHELFEVLLDNLPKLHDSELLQHAHLLEAFMPVS